MKETVVYDLFSPTILLSKIMRRFKIYIICLVLGAFVYSCKKEHITPEGTNGTPVFYFNGDVDGSPVSLLAGVNNYYMYSSDSQSTAGVYSYMGNLKEFGCNSGCVSSIKFILNDYRTLGSGASEPHISDSALNVNAYNYNSPGGTSTKYAVTFTPTLGTSTLTPISYTYDFGDSSGLVSGSGVPVIKNHTYATPGNYKTSLSVKFDTLHTTSLTNVLTLGAPNNAISATLAYSGSINVTFTVAINGGAKPYKVVYNFGDSTGTVPNTTTHTGIAISRDSTTPHSYVDSSHIRHPFVTVTDVNNITTTTNTNLTPTTSSTNEQYFMNYSATPSPAPNPQGLSNVTIIYTDPTGHVYSSADSAQRGPSDFQILSVSNYQNNENNQTTKQLHVKFNCTLYDGLGKSVTITNGDAVIAVAYK